MSQPPLPKVSHCIPDEKTLSQSYALPVYSHDGNSIPFGELVSKDGAVTVIAVFGTVSALPHTSSCLLFSRRNLIDACPSPPFLLLLRPRLYSLPPGTCYPSDPLCSTLRAGPTCYYWLRRFISYPPLHSRNVLRVPNIHRPYLSLTRNAKHEKITR